MRERRDWTRATFHSSPLRPPAPRHPTSHDHASAQLGGYEHELESTGHRRLKRGSHDDSAAGGAAAAIVGKGLLARYERGRVDGICLWQQHPGRRPRGLPGRWLADELGGRRRLRLELRRRRRLRLRWGGKLERREDEPGCRTPAGGLQREDGWSGHGARFFEQPDCVAVSAREPRPPERAPDCRVRLGRHRERSRDYVPQHTSHRGEEPRRNSGELHGQPELLLRRGVEPDRDVRLRQRGPFDRALVRHRRGLRAGEPHLRPPRELRRGRRERNLGGAEQLARDPDAVQGHHERRLDLQRDDRLRARRVDGPSDLASGHHRERLGAEDPLRDADDHDPRDARAAPRDQRQRAERDQSRRLPVRPGPRGDAPRRRGRGGGCGRHERGEDRLQLVCVAVHARQRLSRRLESADWGGRELRDELPHRPLGGSGLRSLRSDRRRNRGRESDDRGGQRLHPPDYERAPDRGPRLLPEPGRGPRRLRDHGGDRLRLQRLHLLADDAGAVDGHDAAHRSCCTTTATARR